MPRKTKEQNDIELKKEENIEKTTTKKATKTPKKASSSANKSSTTKKNNATKTSSTTTKKSTSSTKKASTSSSKSATSRSKTTVAKRKTATSTSNTSNAKSKTKTTTSSTKKKVATSSTRKKAATTKKATTTKKSTTTRKKSSSKKTASNKEKVEVVEYYDLPYRYNQTVVKVLAQTPTNLFIYWDISDKDRKNYEKKYGEHFFENTRPVLIVHNDTIGYSFEVEINDFANSWYLNVADSKCDYRIELGRRPITKTQEIQDDYIYVSTSNEIESPNDHILFNKEQKMVYFKNVKTGEKVSKPISSISFIRNMGKIYNIYDLYKELYQNENIEELYNLSNPSSGNPSSR